MEFKRIATIGAIAASSIVGYFFYKNSNENDLDICFEKHRRLEVSKDSISELNRSLNEKISATQNEILNMEESLFSLKKRVIHNLNQIPIIEEQKQNAVVLKNKIISARDCYWDRAACLAERAAAASKCDNDISKYNELIFSYRTELQNIEKLELPKIESDKLLKSKEVLENEKLIEKNSQKVERILAELAKPCNEK
jgi:hypothetical protein